MLPSVAHCSGSLRQSWDVNRYSFLVLVTWWLGWQQFSMIMIEGFNWFSYQWSVISKTNQVCLSWLSNYTASLQVQVWVCHLSKNSGNDKYHYICDPWPMWPMWHMFWIIGCLWCSNQGSPSRTFSNQHRLPKTVGIVWWRCSVDFGKAVTSHDVVPLDWRWNECSWIN